jgi:hypothetical protein
VFRQQIACPDMGGMTIAFLTSATDKREGPLICPAPFDARPKGRLLGQAISGAVLLGQTDRTIFKSKQCDAADCVFTPIASPGIFKAATEADMSGLVA